MKIVVLISGAGSNLRAIVDAGIAIRAVIADRPCAGLQRAPGVATLIVEPRPGQTRSEYDAELARQVAPYAPDLVVLAGWRRILTMAFLQHYRVINLHPALPGQFPGLHAIERAHASGVAETGVMVHWVPDEGVDVGPTILVEKVAIAGSDTLEDLTRRIRAVEHRLLPEAIRQLLTGSEF